MKWKCPILLALALQFLSLSPARTQGVLPPKDNLQDFTLLGFVVGQTKFAAIEQALGPAKAFGPSGLVCYVTSTPDHTRLTFWPSEYNNDVDGISVTEGSIKLRWESVCRQSEIVTATMATLSGLKLGLSKEAVLARYGSPKDIGPNKIGYYSERPLTDTELKEACAKIIGPAACSSENYTYGEDVQLTFREGALVQFELFRGISQ